MAMIKVIGWAHLEIKGYRQHFGFVTEVDIAGLTMLRIEEPDPETGIRKVHTYSPESLFGYHEMTESEVMERLSPAKRLPEYTPVINEDDHEADTEPPTSESTDDCANQDQIGTDRCHADRDGDCSWPGCPQLRDGEPAKSGRSCPLYAKHATEPPTDSNEDDGPEF